MKEIDFLIDFSSCVLTVTISMSYIPIYWGRIDRYKEIITPPNSNILLQLELLLEVEERTNE